MQRITEKSDVYSYGVVLLEVLTGKHPLDPDLRGGAHLVKWVRDHLAEKKDPSKLLDPRLHGRTDPIMHEMLQTLAVAFLCVSNKASERPLMKDVVAMLTEIRQTDVGRSETDKVKSGGCGSKEPQLMSHEKIISHGSSNCSFAFSDDSV